MKRIEINENIKPETEKNFRTKTLTKEKDQELRRTRIL